MKPSTATISTSPGSCEMTNDSSSLAGDQCATFSQLSAYHAGGKRLPKTTRSTAR